MPAVVRRSKLLKLRLDRFSHAMAGIERGDVRSLHRVRVASRRLRELVPILQLEADTAKKLSRRLRKVTARLGSLRELDVLVALIDDLRRSSPEHREALNRVGVAVAKARDESRKRRLDELPAEELDRVARKLARVLNDVRRSEEAGSARGGPARAKAALWAIDARIAHRAGRLQQFVQSAGALYLPDRLHAVRIAVKKLRYAIELAPASHQPRRADDLRGLRRVQEILGRMHDFQVLIDRVRGVQASLAPPSLAAWRQLDALLTAMDDECRRLHARYVRARADLDELTRRLVAAPSAPSTRSARHAG
ncbi:MAG TPA: CHAD domain-containing protein [Vicinamibacterales bacterium]|jgi:CHAD domain-containing protein